MSAPTGVQAPPTIPAWVTARTQAERIGHYLAQNTSLFDGQTRSAVAVRLNVREAVVREAMHVATELLAAQGVGVCGLENRHGWTYRTTTDIGEFRSSKLPRRKAIRTELTRLLRIEMALAPNDPETKALQDFIVELEGQITAAITP